MFGNSSFVIFLKSNHSRWLLTTWTTSSGRSGSFDDGSLCSVIHHVWTRNVKNEGFKPCIPIRTSFFEPESQVKLRQGRGGESKSRKVVRRNFAAEVRQPACVWRFSFITHYAQTKRHPALKMATGSARFNGKQLILSTCSYFTQKLWHSKILSSISFLSLKTFQILIHAILRNRRLKNMRWAGFRILAE